MGDYHQKELDRRDPEWRAKAHHEVFMKRKKEQEEKEQQKQNEREEKNRRMREQVRDQVENNLREPFIPPQRSNYDRFYDNIYESAPFCALCCFTPSIVFLVCACMGTATIHGFTTFFSILLAVILLCIILCCSVCILRKSAKDKALRDNDCLIKILYV
jgi:hypothetical protein